MNYFRLEDGTPLDTIFEVLADSRRRYVLSYLRHSSNDAASLDELATHVRMRDPDAASAKDVSVDLHHTVLPKLDEAGLLEYDQRSSTVRYRGHPLVEQVLDDVVDRE